MNRMISLFRQPLLTLLLLLGPRAWAQSPAWQTATYYDVSVAASATDANGNIYLAGSYVTPGGDTDAFVGKWSNTANNFTWLNRYGGNKNDQARSIAVGSGGVLYIAGEFASSQVTFGATTLYNAAPTTTGNTDVFVTKLTDAGSSATTGWALKGGSYGYDSQGGLAVAGNSVYVSGDFAYTGTFGSKSISSNSNSLDAFVAKITDGGGTASFTWALAVGSGYQDVLTTLTASGTGVYLAERQAQSAGGGGYLYYIHKVTDTGSNGSVAWSQSAGALVEVNALARNGGSLYAVGGFGGYGSASPFGSGLPAASLFNSYVVKLADTGSGLSATWGQAVAGPGYSTIRGLAVSGTGVFITGSWRAAGTTVTSGTIGLGDFTLYSCNIQSGAADLFVAKLTDAGTSASFTWARSAANCVGRDVQGYQVAVSGRKVLVAGNATAGTSFDGLSVSSDGGVVATLTDPLPPTITSFTPVLGSAGAVVTITGTNLTGTYRVLFNGTAAPYYNSNYQHDVNAAGTQVTVYAPSGAASGPITVTAQGGTVTSAGSFTFAPTLLNIAPVQAFVNNTITANGSNMQGVATITFSGTSNNTVTAGFSVNAAGTQITGIVIPAGARTGYMTVVGPGGTSNSTYFTLRQAPVLSASSYSASAGNYITLQGQYLNGATAVTFSGTSSNTVTSGLYSPSPFYTQLQNVLVPSGATSGPVFVTTANGTSNAVSFTLLASPPPAIGTFAPGSGSIGATVLINGANYSRAAGSANSGGATQARTSATVSSVTFNGVSAAFTVVSPTQLSAVVPVGATTGPIAVTSADGTATSATTFVVLAPAPDLTISIGSLASPTTVSAGTYHTVTITGSGTAQLTGGVVVNTSLTVQSGGTLLTACQPITGPGSFTLAAGATLGICDANGISTTPGQGAVQTTGTRSLSTDAIYLYDGTVAQSTGTGLPAQVRNLTTTNPSTLTLTRPTRVRQVLTVAGAGNLVLNGQPLTLLSDASGTALVVNSGTGVVTGGTATVQRYLTTSNLGRGYRHYSSPVSGNVLTDVATATFTPLFSTAYNTSATPGTITPFPNVFGYDQLRQDLNPSNFSSFDKGWYSPCTGAGNVPDNFLAGRGYAVNLPGTELVDFVGTLRTGDLTLPLVRNFLPTTAEAGWHLLGNPYPAPIDWSAIAIADRPGLDASMYVFESSGSYTGQYRSYVNSIGNTSPLIGSSQGFFVRVSQGQTSGSLTFRNGQRLTSYGTQVAVRRGPADTRPQLRLMLTGNSTGTSDDFYLYAQTGATPGADAEFDAVKLANPSGLNLASLTATGEALAIDGRADFGTAAALRIPLQVSVPAAGSYILTAAAVAHLPLGTTATLVDNLTGTRTALTAGASYRFATTTATAPGRFWLNLAPAGAPLSAASAALEAQVLTFPNPTTGRLTVLRPAGAAASAVLLNALGQVVKTVALPTAETALDLRGLASGVYTLRLTLTGQPVSKRVVLE